MFGDIVFQMPAEDYVEYLLADEQGIRVILCTQYGRTKLYRIEWMDAQGIPSHQAVYSLFDAMSVFRIQLLKK